jgi:hypothetical protein
MWPQNINDWLEAAFYLVGILAAGFSGWNYWRNTKRNRTEWLSKLYERFYTNTELLNIFDRIDWEDSDFLQTQDRNLLLQRDQLLNFFEFVAILHSREELGEEEVKDMFNYPLERIAQVPAIRQYLLPNGYEKLDTLLRELRYPS